MILWFVYDYGFQLGFALMINFLLFALSLVIYDLNFACDCLIGWKLIVVNDIFDF